MKDILMMVHTMGTLDTTDNDRYTYIAGMLTEQGASVKIITSDFEHHKKKYRNKEIAKKYPYKIIFLHENKYHKNICIQRIAGHISFAIRLKRYLRTIKKPDAIYCAVPPTISANILSRYAKKNKIKFVIDVQDLWPESFSIVLGKNHFSDVLLKPISFFVNGVYKRADSIIAVSDTYVSRASMNNFIAKQKYSVYLGTDGKYVDQLQGTEKIGKKETEFWIGYIGNLGNSYDFPNLFKALHLLYMEGIHNIKMVFVGDGVMRKELEDMKQTYFENTIITGYLPYADMFRYLKKCDLAVNPIKKGTAASVINKVGDYAAAGIAVINTQDNKEYRALVENYHAGLNTIPENSKDIAEKIKKLYLNERLRLQMGENNRKLFLDKFDRSKTYQKIVDCLMNLDEDTTCDNR